ncbi:MAG TPA: hypothetical protein VF756_12975 [Thermoanaerobaculia bacterium]
MQQTTIVPIHDVQPDEGKRKRPPRGGGVDSAEERLKSERVQDALRLLQQLGWQLVRGGWSLQRVFGFESAAAASAYSRYVLELAIHHGQAVELLPADTQLTITLQGSPGRDRTFRFSEELLRFAAVVG